MSENFETESDILQRIQSAFYWLFIYLPLNSHDYFLPKRVKKQLEDQNQLSRAEKVIFRQQLLKTRHYLTFAELYGILGYINMIQWGFLLVLPDVPQYLVHIACHSPPLLNLSYYLLYRNNFISMALAARCTQGTLIVTFWILLSLNGGLGSSTLVPYLSMIPMFGMCFEGKSVAFLILVLALNFLFLNVYANELHFNMAPIEMRFFLDITERLAGMYLFFLTTVYQEKTIRTKTESLELALEAAEVATKMKANFLASVSHEMRTPLHHIRLGLDIVINALKAEIAQSSKTKLDDLLEILEKAVSSSSMLCEMIDDALDMSKIDAGALTTNCQIMPVIRTINDTVDMFKDTAARGKINVSIDFEKGSDGIYIFADKMRFGQMLMNLLSNALKFTSEGGSVTVHLYKKKKNNTSLKSGLEKRKGLRRSLSGPAIGSERIKGENIVVVSVEDTGIGIIPEYLEGLFKPFSQADGARTTRQYGGTGLGLAITKHLAEAMDAEILVESEVGVGSKFFLEFSIVPKPKNSTIPETQRSRTSSPFPSPFFGSSTYVLRPSSLSTSKTTTTPKPSLEPRMETRSMRKSKRLQLKDYNSNDNKNNHNDVNNDNDENDETVNQSVRRSRRRSGSATLNKILTFNEYDKDVEEEEEGNGKARHDHSNQKDNCKRKTTKTKTVNTTTTSITEKKISRKTKKVDDKQSSIAKSTTTTTTPTSPTSVKKQSKKSYLKQKKQTEKYLKLFHGIEIFVCDDNNLSCKLLIQLLKNAGIQANYATSGRDTLNYISEIGPPDILLLDLYMPVIDGFQVSLEIQKMPVDKRPKTIVALSATTLAEDREKALACGMLKFLPKPFKTHELFDCLESIVKSFENKGVDK